MTRSSTRVKRKHALILPVLFSCIAWLYFRPDYVLSVVVDMVFPLMGSMFLLFVMCSVERALGLEDRRGVDDTADPPKPHRHESALKYYGLSASLFVFSMGWWIDVDHTGRFPAGLADVLLILAVMNAVLVLCVNALAGVIRSRRAGRSQ